MEFIFPPLIRNFCNKNIKMLVTKVVPQTGKTNSATVIFFHGSGEFFFLIYTYHIFLLAQCANIIVN